MFRTSLLWHFLPILCCALGCGQRASDAVDREAASDVQPARRVADVVSEAGAFAGEQRDVVWTDLAAAAATAGLDSDDLLPAQFGGEALLRMGRMAYDAELRALAWWDLRLSDANVLALVEEAVDRDPGGSLGLAEIYIARLLQRRRSGGVVVDSRALAERVPGHTLQAAQARAQTFATELDAASTEADAAVAAWWAELRVEGGILAAQWFLRGEVGARRYLASGLGTDDLSGVALQLWERLAPYYRGEQRLPGGGWLPALWIEEAVLSEERRLTEALLQFVKSGVMTNAEVQTWIGRFVEAGYRNL